MMQPPEQAARSIKIVVHLLFLYNFNSTLCLTYFLMWVKPGLFLFIFVLFTMQLNYRLKCLLASTLTDLINCEVLPDRMTQLRRSLFSFQG